MSKLVRTLSGYAGCSAYEIASRPIPMVMYFINDAKADIATLAAENERLRNALAMIAAETKESNEPIGRSVFKALATCGEIAELALVDGDHHG